MTRGKPETTLTLLARRATHYLYDRRTRARRGREPDLPFPGLHESLAYHLVDVLPARLLGRVSLAGYLAWTERLARVLAGGGHVAARTVLALRAVWWRTLDGARALRPGHGRRAARAEAMRWRRHG